MPTPDVGQQGPQPLPDIGSADLSVGEVKSLWWFNDGSIMDPYVRHQLWRSWGHCPRHSWGAAVVECELRYQPLGAAILLEDLTRRAAKAISTPLLPWSVLRRRLYSRGDCSTCEYVAKVTRRDPDWVEQTRTVNRRRGFIQYAGSVADVWRRHTCPSCLGGTGLVCREHLIAGEDPPADLSTSLEALADRLRRFTRSMTWGGPHATERERASWIEALGWLSGWDYPYRAGLVVPSQTAR